MAELVATGLTGATTATGVGTAATACASAELTCALTDGAVATGVSPKILPSTLPKGLTAAFEAAVPVEGLAAVALSVISTISASGILTPAGSDGFNCSNNSPRSKPLTVPEVDLSSIVRTVAPRAQEGRRRVRRPRSFGSNNEPAKP